MAAISNDEAFKSQLDQLDATAQRVVGALFVAQVMPLADELRLQRALAVAKNPNADEDELASALRMAKAVALESHARCGAECDWQDQAVYFVARALAAALAPRVRSGGKDPAWQAALSCRMARMSAAMEEDSAAVGSENEQQYQILGRYLDTGRAAAGAEQ